MKYLDNGYSFEKVAEIFKWKESQLFEYLEEFSPKSLDVEFEDKNCTLLDKSNDTFRNFLIKYTRDEINSQLKDILSKKDLNIVEMKDSYAGINPSFEDIGNFLFISGERARQLYHRAEKKILKDKKLNEIIKSGVTL